MTRSLILICALVLAGCSAAPAPKTLTLSNVSLADDAVTLALAQEVDVNAAASGPGLFGQLFGGGTKPAVTNVPARSGPDARDVQVGTLLPYGQIARNCAVTQGQMGKKVDANAGYTLYDTAPGSITLRTQYLTGFNDKCTRQFTAATSMIGDIGTHEIVRYLPTNAKMAYSVTDMAYETVKSSYCRVGQGKPCGKKLDRFAQRTTFVTAYEKFGSNPSWSNILLHEGGVVAMGPAAP